MTQQQAKTAGVAVASLVCGIAGLMCVGPLGAVPAVICGHVAMSRIRASGGALGGEGLAIAGLVMGYVSVAVTVVIVPLLLAIAVPNFMKAREMTQGYLCERNLRAFEAAKAQYAAEAGLAPGAEIVPASALNRYLDCLTVETACPAGGTYVNIAVVGTPASCSVHGLPGPDEEDDDSGPAPPQE